MDRFIKTLSLLIISLFLLGAGLNATLDRLADSPRGSQLSIYGRDGRVLAVYTGNLRDLEQVARANEITPPRRSL
jgi:hypothetical protein